MRRAFAGVDLRALDPFIHMDQMGEVDYAPGEPKGTAWHPHRGFETVTYMIDGTFRHQDSNGGGGLITNGDTQWMTAGGGILHIEEPPEELVVSGGLFHGVQLWVNLPARGQDGPAALPGHPGRPGGAADVARRRRAACGSSPARSPGTPARASRTRRSPLLHATVEPGAELAAALAARLQRARPTSWPGRARVGAERRPVRDRSAGGVRAR